MPSQSVAYTFARDRAGKFPTQTISEPVDSIVNWCKKDENIEATDIIVYHTFGTTHVARPEQVGHPFVQGLLCLISKAGDAVSCDAGRVRLALLDAFLILRTKPRSRRAGSTRQDEQGSVRTNFKRNDTGKWTC